MSIQIETNINGEVKSPEVNVGGPEEMIVGGDAEIQVGDQIDAQVVVQAEIEAPNVEIEAGCEIEVILDEEFHPPQDGSEPCIGEEQIGGDCHLEQNGSKSDSSKKPSNNVQIRTEKVNIGGDTLEMNIKLDEPMIVVNEAGGGIEIGAENERDIACCYGSWIVIFSLCYAASTAYCLYLWVPLFKTAAKENTQLSSIDASTLNWTYWIFGVINPICWLTLITTTCCCFFKNKRVRASQQINLENCPELGGDANDDGDLFKKRPASVDHFEVIDEAEIEVCEPEVKIEVDQNVEVNAEIEGTQGVTDVEGAILGEMGINVEIEVNAEETAQVEAQADIEVSPEVEVQIEN